MHRLDRDREPCDLLVLVKNAQNQTNVYKKIHLKVDQPAKHRHQIKDRRESFPPPSKVCVCACVYSGKCK